MRHTISFANYIGLLVFIIIVGLPVFNILYAQKHTIENVSFQVMDNNFVVVNYDLLGKDKRYIVDLTLRRRDFPVFSHKPQTVLGDIGKGRFAGKDKKILWSMDHDITEGFVADPFVKDYYFTIEARRKRSTAWLWITTLIGGATWYLVFENPQF